MATRKSITLDLSRAEERSGGSKPKFTVEYLTGHGADAKSAAAAVKTYQGKPTAGAKAIFRKKIEEQLGLIDLSEVATRAAESAKRNASAKATPAKGKGKGNGRKAS